MPDARLMQELCSHRPVSLRCLLGLKDGPQGRGYSVRNPNSRPLLQSQLLFDFLHSGDQFSEPVNPGNLLLCFCKRNCRGRPPRPATDVLGYTALRTDSGVITDLDMPNDTNLTANQHTLTDLDAARNSGLRCDNSVLSDHDVV